ncbi:MULTISPECIES: hypothetical protein [unclassified Plantactinospora]|uniref:hypothetical protein n=1 Tax=unclassified Plantactinospora TaxID=2631981 RepID=UPI000D17C7B1|nr:MULTISPECIES: hypothetical protein [unclassified Plantactinospora]AVT31173.1 hypothetical protein C6361_18715 [Plantactinospora sp. BC1]AVT39719.1 hypothetical protein C6W10_28405 [Plantactinospora sp. BB1]
MTERSERAPFPRRDDQGRIVVLADLLGVALVGVVVGLVALLVIDLGASLVGLGEFGRASGWLAVVLPAWIFVEEFRAWRFGPARVAAALVAAAVGIAVGLLAAGLAASAPPLVSGGLAAAVFAMAYALVWFVGVRWLAGRTS